MVEASVPPETNVISGQAQPASQGDVVYVQGMNNPMNAGQYPQTQAVVALVLSVVGLMMCGLCTAVPGVIMANTALGTTKQYPGHPDQGLAKAAQIVGWITIGLWIVIIGFYLLMFVVVIAAEA
ncbi:MAG: DUF4190 domain-containing protein [Candidatus Poseidoniales archaeon]|nr:DUF4190 domain-containing protein [Candidatus Poseidoniales archaeon]RCH71731.1 MAG: DUF4190 domain-containing protein [Candidatus Poseidoniales archaeon]RCH72478.1 MAG: DUF4190 domain-containing protein [Candidatus Poseidoniales archaeon]|tara:strand:+ start:352 stop:723 length:372 start_codon:yes stop_codon:yes gene_type:complete